MRRSRRTSHAWSDGATRAAHSLRTIPHRVDRFQSTGCQTASGLADASMPPKRGAPFSTCLEPPGNLPSPKPWGCVVFPPGSGISSDQRPLGDGSYHDNPTVDQEPVTLPVFAGIRLKALACLPSLFIQWLACRNKLPSGSSPPGWSAPAPPWSVYSLAFPLFWRRLRLYFHSSAWTDLGSILTQNHLRLLSTN